MSNNKERENILDLSHLQARKFFIKHKSYCNFDLPPYILFNTILETVNSHLEGKKFRLDKNNPKDEEKINHTILHNKDGKYAWRPFQLIHPVLYVSLVHNITEEKNWKTIRERFKKFKEESKIKCTSIPVISFEKKKDKSEQILSWWEEVEQQSIKMSIDYEYLIHVDISNCYSSIYTHSIPWAIHDRKEAKKNRGNNNLIGNIIDQHLQSMSYGQTNGIPQGSILMDFIAEIVLGYVDNELTKKIEESSYIKNHDDDNYDIIRYRDDYRIFTNNPKVGEEIVKLISEILVDFGMTLNPNKTRPNNQIIKGSIKPDKLHWMQQEEEIKRYPLQKHLILIHDFSMKFPNSGSLMKALSDFYDNLLNCKNGIKGIYQLISIITDIAYYNPKTYPISAAIASKLINNLNKNEQKEVIEKIRKKFKKIPNTGHLDIWLQRIVIGFNEKIPFNEPICKLVDNGNNISVWKFNWLKEESFKQKIKETPIIDKIELNEVKGKVIQRKEFSVFPRNYYWSS